MLTLLCTATRPLAVEELIDAIAVELGDDPRFNEDSRLMDKDDIRRICPGFIEMDFQPDDDETTVRIAHYSVQEYLESDRILASKTARFSVRRAEANTEVASICLVYLMDRKLCEAYVSQTAGLNAKYPLAIYAAKNWPNHYRGGIGSDPHLRSLTLELLHDKRTALTWLSIFRSVRFTGVVLHTRILSPLYLAAELGLDPVVRALLASDYRAEHCHEDYTGPALVAAAAHGYASTVQLLLDYGANINYLGLEGTPLHLSSARGHPQVVKTLLDRGADTEAHDHCNKTSLYNAAPIKIDNGVRLLLDRGANINPTGSCEIAEESAAVTCREDMAAILLARDAHRNQLPFEAARSRIRAEQLLADRDAPLMLSSHSIPMELAPRNDTADGLKEVINDFLAELRPRDIKTPLEMACFAGGPAVVECLLNRGADVDKAGGYPNLLECAVSGGNVQVARLLLDRGADVNEGKCHLPMEVAAVQLRVDMMQLLVDRGADVNRGRAQTPLEAAVDPCQYGSNLLLLLEWGADANLGIRMTPLESAAAKRLADRVISLLEGGADANLGIRITPLEAAARKRTEYISGLLLDQGADINRGITMTPLEALLDSPGTTEPFHLAQLLVERGADVNRGIRMAPLQMAKEKGYDEIARLLIEKMASVEEQIGTVSDKGGHVVGQ